MSEDGMMLSLAIEDVAAAIREQNAAAFAISQEQNEIAKANLAVCERVEASYTKQQGGATDASAGPASEPGRSAFDAPTDLPEWPWQAVSRWGEYELVYGGFRVRVDHPEYQIRNEHTGQTLRGACGDPRLGVQQVIESYVRMMEDALEAWKQR